uniref:Uncharacterized protein n=1 Tax=Ananas comosus var. bracteatus TaxID=296719 RepID=A0A6V7PQ60_ANACO|nr:unnamed protein product [Ananas comosus var. bracteatus]
MNDLWNKWRGDLHRKFVKPCKTIQEALKHIPEGVDRGDWEWLVKEHFSSEKFMTRKKVDKLVEQETISRYDKIVEVTQAEPSLSNIELVEKCFGPQRHDHVVCYGGGLKPNAIRTSGSKVELQAKLRESQRENQSLRNRMDEMENEVRMIKEMLQCQQSNTSPPQSSGQTSHLHQMGNQYDHI